FCRASQEDQRILYNPVVINRRAMLRPAAPFRKPVFIMRKTSQFALLAQRRFAPFFCAQFLGAFNDNVFKTALLTALTFDALSWTTMDRGLLNNLIPGVFILPFVLFSALSGQFADKF